MNSVFDLIWVVIALPLAGFLFHAFFGKRVGKKADGTVGTAVVLGAFALSVYLLLELLRLPAEERQVVSTLWRWIEAGTFRVSFEALVDPLSLLMALIVTGVGGLIHLYSTGYMAEDEDYPRFFTYMNLFIVFMLTLVLSNNLLMMFVGWEGVGLCSYLLIGFWYRDKVNTDSANKAFIVNRIGDWGFMLAVILSFWTFGTLSFAGEENMFQKAIEMKQAGMLAPGVIAAIALLLFVGATGKSAQFPLYMWLPDAMAGPTPVSALIHAATMVTAGVVMVTRCHVFYELAPTAMLVVAVIGVFTAIFAATIAIAQTDIKRVLAYSTVSQLGYMFLGCGVGAFASGMFHVTTHAFFKALLFLGSGSVILAMHHEQDMRRMGGLAKYLPITYWTMLAGWLAIAGIPPLAGFFSKDEILASAFGTHALPVSMGQILWAVGLVTALLTAFYMTRLMGLTFWGEPRWATAHTAHHGKDDAHGHHGEPSESPPSMTIPLMILAVLSVVGGFVGGFAPLHIPNRFEAFLEPSAGLKVLGEEALGHLPVSIEWILVGASVAAAVLGIWFGWARYRAGLPENERELAGVRKVLYNQYYYDWLMVKGIGLWLGGKIAHWMWQFVDVRLIDGLVNGIAGFTGWTGNRLRRVQTGYVRNYAFTILIGAIVLLIWFLVRGASAGLTR
ncbi:MAG: NADH-quinone oxidoreductase subunit L [Armatimonadota bacterium]|nr:MAG: NADH-quinone oxidoreductase subunit L [Armatimonadota bacterium]